MTKIGRNDPCPCGSGKKYKHCCLSKEVRVVDPLPDPLWGGPPLLQPPPSEIDPTWLERVRAGRITFDETEAADDAWDDPAATPKDRAYDLIEEAWATEDHAARIELAKRALAEWPDAVDAYTLLGDESLRPEAAVEYYQQALAAVDRVIGADW